MAEPSDSHDLGGRGRLVTPNPIEAPIRPSGARVEVDEVVRNPFLGRASEAGLVQLEPAPDGSGSCS